MFKCQSNIAHIKEIQGEEEEDPKQDDMLIAVARSIKSEVKDIAKLEGRVYKRRINTKSARKDESPTLSRLLHLIDPKS